MGKNVQEQLKNEKQLLTD